MRIDAICCGYILVLGFGIFNDYARGDDSTEDRSFQQAAIERTVYAGQLFYDGKHITGPYFIAVDQTSDDNFALSVNGIPMKIKADFDQSGIDDVEPDRRRGRPAFEYGDRQRLARGGSRPPWELDSNRVPQRQDPTRRRSSPDQDAEMELRSRKRSNTRVGVDDEPIPSAKSDMQELTLANQIAFALRRDDIVVAFPGAVVNILSAPSEKADFCRMFIEAEASETTQGDFLSLVHPEQLDAWSAMPQKLAVSQSLSNWMRGCIAESDAIFQTNQREILAVKIMDRSAYPLTIIGMMLGVFALGHTLRWSSLNPAGEEAIRFVRIALMLILAMSALDLIWTALSGAAGEMRELNPMAVQLMDSPGLLVVFKLVVTLAACGILLALRTQPKAQFATWWMCLVCVLLTFRWVVFQSLLV